MGAHRHANEDHQHSPKYGPSLPRVTDHAAEYKTQRRWNQKCRDHLREVAEWCGVLERVRRVGIEESPAVGAQHFDGFLRRYRSHGKHLIRGTHGVRSKARMISRFDDIDLLVRREVLDNALSHQQRRQQQRQRQ